MKNSPVFTTIKLSDNRECSILEIKPFHFWRANFQMATLNADLKYEFIPYLLEQIILIDYKTVTIDEIGNLDITDYTEIGNIVGIIINKLPK